MKLIVDLGWLTELHGDLDSTSSTLDNGHNNDVAVPSSPTLDRGLRSFFGRYDERGGELSEGLKGVNSLVAAIHDSFEEADTELGAATSGDGS